MPVPGVPAGRADAWVLCASVALAACGHHPGADADSGASAVDSTLRRDILAIEKKRYSQHDEELIIRDFFQDRRGGFFVDVGCAWPKRDNNTCYLETELGWSGIGIDALPEYARGWKARRPRSRFFNFIVTDHSGSVETFFRSELKGISSVRPRETFSGKRVRYEEIRVPTITLSRLLDDNGVSKVDLLSMDIEGAEPRALAGFDIDRFRPELVCIEMFHAGAETLEAYFAAHGYERIERYREHDKANAYFSPRASVAGAAAR
jgi:FkbM family methyltransferase